ncbi:MAG TPA: YXWGXW repeat-containing protein [Polyangiaceae bacterium]|nr:YXWGXW repeat-containing protein [Polyangiaceae bacterium]
MPEPKLARQPRSEYLPVPYPPPAAFSEVVPPAPNRGALWIDGHWAWRGRTYVWQRGGWVLPPRGARFAPWNAHYTRDGTLLFADEIWYDAKLQPMPSPKKLVSAFTPPNELTPETQHGF